MAAAAASHEATGNRERRVCWVLADEKAGNLNPCLGLAEAVGLETVVKRVYPRFPWSRLPPQLWIAPFSASGPGSDPLEPPWPDLLIAAGRQTVALALAIRRRSRGGTFAVQILDPRVPPGCFDLVVAPGHDRLAGANVMATTGALNRITDARLAEAAAAFEPRIAHLPHPRIAVLIGGTSRRHRLDEATAAGIGDHLAELARNAGAGLMVTASRRTGEANARALAARLSGLPAVIWDGAGDNPLFGYLGLADAIVVTDDSVAMVSEACSTGKPVYVAALPTLSTRSGKGSAKFDRFHEALARAGCTRPLTGDFEPWTYEPLRETARVAVEVRRRMGLA